MRTAAYALVDTLEQLGVILAVNDNKLRVDAPKGVISATTKDQLATFKPEIIDLLQRQALCTAQTQQVEKEGVLKTYKAVVDGKGMTILDPLGRPESAMRDYFGKKFGDRLGRIM